MKYLFQAALICLILPSNGFTQTTEFEGYFRLNSSHKVFKLATRSGCPENYTIPGGVTSTKTTTKKFTNDKNEIVVEYSESPAAGSIIIVNTDKSLKIPLFPNAEGDCNLYVEDKDKSIIYVNYGLARRHVVNAATMVVKNRVDYSCAGNPNFVPDNPAPYALAANETINAEIVQGSDLAKQATTWFRNSDNIAVYTAAGALSYYLVKRYDGAQKYVLELDNRKYISYFVHSLDFGALTIPFKYRVGFTKNGIKIPDDVSANFNVGVYAGYKLTRSSVINKAGTYKLRNHASFRIGPFLNASAVAVDSISSTVGKVPFKGADKRNIAVLSTGLGFMGDFRGVQIGIYSGWDFAVGPDASNWNYHKRFWLGFGFGYKLTDLFAKKD